MKLPNSGKNIFYWHVVAFEDAETKPLVWWTNGGPGCSGLLGLASEMGPFTVKADMTLERNPNTWSHYVNMVYVEQPAGVGFSYYAEGDEPNMFSDAQATEDNLAFILQFMAAHPEYQDTEFYLAGESWGGHYVPLLTQKILQYLKQHPDQFNFKGFLVGNPYTNDEENTLGMIETMGGRSLIPQALVKQVKEACFSSNPAAEVAQLQCYSMLNQVDSLTDDIYVYGVDFAKCPEDPLNSSVALKSRQRHSRNLSKNSRKLKRSMRKRKLADSKKAEPLQYLFCEDEYMSRYFNLAEVQKALGVVKGKWEGCNDHLFSNWDQMDYEQDMALVHEWIASNHAHVPGFKALVYSGDDDLVCPTLGTQMWMDKSFKQHEQLGWAVWKYDSWLEGTQVGGFQVVYDNGYLFRTVHGAGHMVPQTQPERAEQLLIDFLNYSPTENIYE